ncbi:craniofacial development protein 2-like isoform X1 [Bubalus kerabau]|uniref:craniofacial development protein 2-like isoform X1 n=1 Tax=Bubalus carabanensis TaxID=3119969 RepID=UPI00244ECD72|nr:craniofacial development protein 2-like isoform X1 [Bubalus carabanensis]
MPEGLQPRGVTPTSEVRGSSREYQTTMAQERPRGATPRPRSGGPAQRRYPASEGKPFNITVIQVYAPTSNAEEAEVERFYEDLQDLLELTPKKDVLFIIGDWNAKVGSQETPGVTGKFGLGIWNEAGQRLIEFCQENALVIANTLFQQHKRRLCTWMSPDGQY